MNMISFNVFFKFCYCIRLVTGWDLSNFNIGTNYYISSIAIYRTKAFLALPRSICHNNVSNPTVVDVPWTGDYIYPSTSITANLRHQILDYQQWGVCEDLQDAISLAVEPKKPKIWILDKGSDLCPPKIASFTLSYNHIYSRHILENIPRANLNILVIDPEYDQYGYRAYIGNAGNNILLVFSLEELKLWELTLSPIDYPFGTISVDFMSISKTEPVLYIAGKNTTELFSLKLEQIRDSEDILTSNQVSSIFLHLGDSVEYNVTFHGHKLGLATGLETDLKSGLSYFMVNDNVILRWLIGSPLRAEFHDVLAQSYEKLPYVSDLFTGPQYGLWALVNPLPPEQCIELNAINENIPKPRSRVVRILKYNKFLDSMS
ncbi:hypothetical protein NQ317_012552 [Molorchus minor]|uniref:Uncharacterized protein n=1 Tax=Molorchus minor TaxID=1323400 RepID=A0ABQ9K147_9CUCU|nr:hypothetical protein NQ317_012552 [Molorchus minor]